MGSELLSATLAGTAACGCALHGGGVIARGRVLLLLTGWSRVNGAVWRRSLAGQAGCSKVGGTRDLVWRQLLLLLAAPLPCLLGAALMADGGQVQMAFLCLPPYCLPRRRRRMCCPWLCHTSHTKLDLRCTGACTHTWLLLGAWILWILL